MIDVVNKASPFKPKMRQLVTYDCGWRYEWWMCHGHGFKAFGKNQEEAYKSWVNGWNLGYVWG